MPPYILAVDLGGTQIRAALCDVQGQILRRIAYPTQATSGLEAVIKRLEDTIAEALGSTPADQILGIGIGAPGPLNPVTGIIMEAPNLPGWRNIPLRNIISARFGLPTFLGNDANLAGLAEHTFGAGRGQSDMIYLTISTGVGSGIIVDGRMLLGARGLGAEAGHTIVDPEGPLCSCGHHGCLESFASGTSIARDVAARIKAGKKSRISKMVGGDLAKIDAKTVGEAAKLGDKVAIQAFRRAGKHLGIGIANLLRQFNPTMIVLGGSVTKAGALLFDPMWAAIKEYVPPIYWEGLAIVPAALGDDVGLLGAAALVATQSRVAAPSPEKPPEPPPTD